MTLRPLRSSALAVTALLIGACSGMPNVTHYLSPYRVDVRQGNFVTQTMVAQLKPGQTRDQVRFILGTPLLADQFHSNRWDYIYRFQPGRGEAEQRRLAVYFDNNRLARVDGDVTAGEAGAAVVTPIRTIEIQNPRAAANSEAPAPAPAVAADTAAAVPGAN
jgi:outer membrane protein assembly factor BamE